MTANDIVNYMKEHQCDINTARRVISIKEIEKEIEEAKKIEDAEKLSNKLLTILERILQLIK